MGRRGYSRTRVDMLCDEQSGWSETLSSAGPCDSSRRRTRFCSLLSCGRGRSGRCSMRGPLYSRVDREEPMDDSSEQSASRTSYALRSCRELAVSKVTCHAVSSLFNAGLRTRGGGGAGGGSFGLARGPLAAARDRRHQGRLPEEGRHRHRLWLRLARHGRRFHGSGPCLSCERHERACACVESFSQNNHGRPP